MKAPAALLAATLVVPTTVVADLDCAAPQVEDWAPSCFITDPAAERFADETLELANDGALNADPFAVEPVSLFEADLWFYDLEPDQPGSSTSDGHLLADIPGLSFGLESPWFLDSIDLETMLDDFELADDHLSDGLEHLVPKANSSQEAG